MTLICSAQDDKRGGVVFLKQMNLTRIAKSIRYYIVGIYKHADEDHYFLLAAGIAFNVLYCVLPLSLVIFYFFSAALSRGRAVGYVVSYVAASFPIPISAHDVRAWLVGELSKMGHNSTIAGIVGGITLFWLASILFSTLRTSVNIVFHQNAKKNMVFQKLLDFVLIILVLVLLLTSTFLSPVVNLMQRLGSEVLPQWLAAIVNTTVPRFLTLAVSIVLYGVLFWMLPHERLPRKVIYVSAATSVILTEAMRLLFVYYMTHISSIRTLYGTYAFLAGIALWLYYASLAFLIGAEVGWLYKERHGLVRIPRTRRGPSNDAAGSVKHAPKARSRS